MKKLEKFISPDELTYFSDKGESMSDAQNFKGKCTQIMEIIRGNFEGAGAVKEHYVYEGRDVIKREPIRLSAADIEKYAGKDGEVNTLNAWFSKAINAKVLLLENIKNSHSITLLEDGEQIAEVEVEEFKDKVPTIDQVTAETVLATWAPNERAEFLLMDQQCAALGKLIHKNRVLHNIYNSPEATTSKMVELASGTGYNKVYPLIFTPMYEKKELVSIREIYIKLHDKHREIEKKVNWYKAKLNNQVSEGMATAQEKYTLALEDYRKSKEVYDAMKRDKTADVNNKNKQLLSKCEGRRVNLLKEVSGMKIFIPEILRPIKTFVEEFDFTKN